MPLQRAGPRFIFVFCVVATLCDAQSRDVLCRDGSGNFEAEFHTGVRLRLGAARRTEGELATRACGATLSWDKQEIVVATEASQLDVDTFGVDLGVGVPVVTFQVKSPTPSAAWHTRFIPCKSRPGCCVSLPAENFFSASDKDLDSLVEIWTDDAAAVDGIENLVVGELDFPPTIVLRFERNQLLDVSSEFRPYFDQEIAKLRAELDPQRLRDFKNSDGKLSPAAQLSPEQLHHLRVVKIKVLEIVWSYLYSGREAEAWRSLADMWPTPDAERIRTAILNARARGIRTQVDRVSSGVPIGRCKHATIFDAITRSEPRKSGLVPPEPMLLRRPPPLNASEQGLQTPELLLDLLIDSAGKVRSAEPAEKVKWADRGLIIAAMEWKFIHAFASGRAVASRLRLNVSAKQYPPKTLGA